MSEIDDKEFLGGYKHSNQKRDGALSQGVASEHITGRKSSKIAGDADKFEKDVNLLLDSNKIENLNSNASPHRPA